VWRAGIEGGRPEKIAGHQFSANALSPDGMLAAGTVYDAERRRPGVGILDLAKPSSSTDVALLATQK